MDYLGIVHLFPGKVLVNESTRMTPGQLTLSHDMYRTIISSPIYGGGYVAPVGPERSSTSNTSSQRCYGDVREWYLLAVIDTDRR